MSNQSTSQPSAGTDSSPAVGAAGFALTDPLRGVKRRWATYSPERLLSRGVVVFLVAKALHAILEPWYLRELTRMYFNSDLDLRWLLGCIVWLSAMISWFAIVQMIWAGLRLIADAIRSTRHASDDRPAWPPASKS